MSTDIFDVFDDLKPFGNGFSKPVFKIVSDVQDVKIYKNKHTAVVVDGKYGVQKIMFFNQVLNDIIIGEKAEFVVNMGKNYFNGRLQLNLFGIDYKCLS